MEGAKSRFFVSSLHQKGLISAKVRPNSDFTPPTAVLFVLFFWGGGRVTRHALQQFFVKL